MRREKRTSNKYDLRRFLGKFAKMAEAIIKSRHIRLSAWNNSVPAGQIFMKFYI